jgi:DNA-binding LacI/PurR family transcriptional regulator
VQLTTVRSDAMEMSRRAVELLLAATRAGRHVSHREMLPNPLVIRATTGKPPA